MWNYNLVRNLAPYIKGRTQNKDEDRVLRRIYGPKREEVTGG
jgi:hypothetical protein